MPSDAHFYCSNEKCKKPLRFPNAQIVGLTIIFKDALGGKDFPSTGRMYCNQQCYDEMISNVNVGVPPMMQVDILETTRVTEAPVHYRIICRPKNIFKLG